MAPKNIYTVIFTSKLCEISFERGFRSVKMNLLDKAFDLPENSGDFNSVPEIRGELDTYCENMKATARKKAAKVADREIKPNGFAVFLSLKPKPGQKAPRGWKGLVKEEVYCLFDN